MGRLFDLKERIDRTIADRHLDPMKTRGAIALRAGFLLGLIKPNTPDDEDQLAKLQRAATEVLNTRL